MSEQEQDNLAESRSEGLADAQPVCPKCFEPCHPLQSYCEHCDSNEVINPLASYMPFVRIRFNIGMLGRLWGRIWYDEETSTACKVFFWLLLILAVLLLPG